MTPSGSFSHPEVEPPLPSSATGLPDVAVTLPDTLRRAEAGLDKFRTLMSSVPFDGEGIPMSEMFFLFCALGDPPPERVLESGRGGGQSTHVLGHGFPGSTIISIEENERSPNAQAALARLQPFKNVDCRFGDSRRLMAEILQPGDVVLIDGPKEFRALQLAFQLLRTGQPRAVFIHDLHPESPARRFLDAHLKSEVFYSADPSFEEKYAFLDETPGAPPTMHLIKKAERGYGPTLACIGGSGVQHVDFSRLLGRLKMARFFSHGRDKWRVFVDVFPGGKSARRP